MERRGVHGKRDLFLVGDEVTELRGISILAGVLLHFASCTGITESVDLLDLRSSHS